MAENDNKYLRAISRIRAALNSAIPYVREEAKKPSEHDARLATPAMYSKELINFAYGSLDLLESVHASMIWQPIETAPKDSTSILLCFKCAEEHLNTSVFRFCDEEWQEYFSGRKLDVDDVPITWMPLPKPPEESGN